jgi:hypothetical protein
MAARIAVALFMLLSIAPNTLLAYITQEEQELLDWIRREGGDFHVTISRNAAGVRGVFTTREVRAGEVLINIPDHLVFSVRNVPAAVSRVTTAARYVSYVCRLECRQLEVQVLMGVHMASA